MSQENGGNDILSKKKERKEKIYFLALGKDTENVLVSQVIRACESAFFLESSHKFVKDFTICEKLSIPMQEVGAILHSPNSTMYLLLYNLNVLAKFH